MAAATVWFFGLLLCYGASPVIGDDRFEKQVAPILERRCLTCHNTEDRKGGFSLVHRATAMEDGYIVAGDPEGSHLLSVITPQDAKGGAARMPKNSDPLSAKELAVIRAWIASGAEWPKQKTLQVPKVSDFDWWSYQPLSAPPTPQPNESWGRNVIDRFVLAKLEEVGLQPARAADRRTLIRRLTYDLTGLPPTPAETEAFLNDESAGAYDALVQRLLDSPAYGERWARHWLDVVKYADTCGYDKDKLRPNAWPYRDYVIRSLNQDKPYGQFVQEQIAGDILFPGRPDGILGLGFIAAGPWDFIGHVEVPESKIDGKVARNLDRDDMVSNAINTFCSVTVQCARCHNHKFDPVTQQDYYGLQAIFAAVDRAERPYDVGPSAARRRDELMTQQSSLNKQLAEWEQATRAAGGEELMQAEADIKRLEARQTVQKSAEFGFHSSVAPGQKTSKAVAIELPTPVSDATIVLHPCHDDFANIGSGFGFPVRFRVETSLDGKRWATALDESADDFPNPGLSPVTTERQSSPIKFVRVSASHLAKRSNDYIMALAELEVLNDKDINVARNAKVTSLDSIEAPPRWSRKNLTDGRWPRGGEADVEEQLAAATARQGEILKRLVTKERADEKANLEETLSAVTDQLAKLPKPNMVYAAATHFKPQGNFRPTEGKLRPIHVLRRGNVTQPGAAAEPGFLPFAAEDDSKIDAMLDDGQRRAAFARWLTNKGNPLVWRSIVNRVWHYHFGRGLVATPNDFGRMGARPTHPQLLDWLAVEFRDNGQSLKWLHRLVVTSSTYRQASDHNAAKAAVDGGNRFLWRMNRRRLSAEEIRDSILSVSGALDRKMGGPGFYLFELEKTAHSPHYEYHKFDPSDAKSHRRSVYRFIVRSQPDPWMTTLDCADSSQSTPKRNETLTSLQALSLLNNRFNLVMAERFAADIEAAAVELDDQVDLAFERVVQRATTDHERQAMAHYADKHGLTNLCRMLFNLSEFVFID